MDNWFVLEISQGGFPDAELQVYDYGGLLHFFAIKRGIVDEMMAEVDGLMDDFCDEVDCGVSTGVDHRRNDKAIQGRIPEKWTTGVMV